MDMENKNEELEFDLDDILSEFHEEPDEALPEVEPDEELNALLQMPELSITPVTVKDPELPLLSVEEIPEPEAAVSQDATVTFEPVPDDLLAQAVTEAVGIMEEAAVSQEDTIVLPVTEEADEAQTSAQPVQAEPAFEVEEVFIPSPIIFTPKSRLKELKKQLVAGPEKRYYELSELGVGRLQLALLANVVVVLICIAVTTMFALDMVPENRLKLVIFSQVLAMMVSALLGSHLMLDSLADILKGRFSVNTLLTLTFAACMVDGIFCLMELRIPCCAAFSLEMTMALWARLQKRNTETAQMDTMRKATRLNGIIKGEHYYEGKDGLLRTEGQVADFMDTYNKITLPEIGQSLYAVLSLLACVGIAVFSGYLHGLSMGVQILSTSLLVAVPASFFVTITRPMAILETRLHMVGTVLCGWEGVKDLCGKAAFLINDMDLFPQGSTKFNGVKFYGDRNPDEVVSYTASLMNAAGGGLVPAFRQLLKSRSGTAYRVENFQNYGDGGIGGEVRGESVLMGTMDFLQDMGVEIPEGTTVSQAVYAAIDGQLCAVYAISYAKMRSASAGLVTLCSYRKLTLLKKPGDFMLTENFLRSKFGIKTNRMRFLDREEAAALEQYRPDPNEPVLALTTRDELVSTAYAITGARALRQSIRLGMGIHLIGGILGLIIMLILGYTGSVELLTPTNVLLYQLIWAVPGLLVTEWTRTV